MDKYTADKKIDQMRCSNNKYYKNIFMEIIDVFFGAEEYEDLKKQGILTSFSFSALFSAEWGIFVLSQVLAELLVKLGWVEKEIFLLFWIGNMVFSSAIIIFNGKTKSDPTLMEGSRRLTDLAFRKSIAGGILMEVIYFVGLVAYAETSSFYIYFKKRMGPFPVRAVIFVVVAGIKMFLWTKVYLLGVSVIDVVWGLIKHAI